MSLMKMPFQVHRRWNFFQHYGMPISNEVQHVENWQIFFNNLSTFKIDLRKLWNQRPVRSFRRAHRRRKMRACMILKSTETIAIEDAFPSRAALLLRRSFHNIRYNLCGWRRSWRWVRRCPATPFTMAHLCWQLDCFLEFTSTWLIKNSCSCNWLKLNKLRRICQSKHLS